MTELLNLSMAKLKRIVALKQQIERLSARLQAVAGSTASAPGKPGRKKRTVSAAARRRMAAAAKLRWAKAKAGKANAAPKKRTMSAAARAKIAAAARARWAKIKAAKK
jgi:hypothetical protein